MWLTLSEPDPIWTWLLPINRKFMLLTSVRPDG